MSSQLQRQSGSFAPSAVSPDRLPPRQRWNHRYANLPADARRKPLPFVAQCLPQLPTAGRALDIAAGAGRHAIAMAQHGLQVDAVDISAQAFLLARRRMDAASLTEAYIQFIIGDIERPWLPCAQYDVALVSFFLHRPLFPLIRKRLRPGGWLVYESFTVLQEIAPNNQPIRPHFMLKPDELRAAFSDFDILLYDEGLHNGKETARLLARKPMS
jgi:tellurite methyltransferase